MRSSAGKELQSLGKILYHSNLKLQKELCNAKLQSIYASCNSYGSSLVFVLLTMVPIIGHVLLDLPWYCTIPSTLLAHFVLSNRGKRRYQNAALEIISDHNLLNLIRTTMPLWSYHDSEPCGWVNDMLKQCWDKINLYAAKKVRFLFMIPILVSNLFRALGTRQTRTASGALQTTNTEEDELKENRRRRRTADDSRDPFSITRY